MEAVPEVFLSEQACGGFLGCGLVCAYPVHRWWKGLSVETRAKIPLILSAIIGTGDSVLDWIVLSDWYASGPWRIATALLLCILIAGCMLAVIVTKKKILKDYTFMYRFVYLTIILLGLGNIILAFLVAQQSPVNADMYSTFYMGRVLEVFIEAAPGGALQLYHLLTEKQRGSGSSINPSTVSIALSVFSIGFGIEESIGKFITMRDRIILWIFSTSDFLFRVLSIIFFLKEYQWAEFFAVPMILICETIIWYRMFTLIGGNDQSLLMNLMFSCIYAIPSVCTCGISLSFDFSLLRRYFLEHFLSRFCLSCVLYGISISSSGMSDWSYIILVLSIVSLIGAIRLNQLISSEGSTLSFNEDLLKMRLKEKNADTFITWAAQGNRRMVKQMLFDEDVKVDVNLHDDHERTALHDAAKNGHSEIVALLIDAECNVNAQSNGDYMYLQVLPTIPGWTALHDAAKNGHSEVVTLLIDAECNVNAKDHEGWTALHCAVNSGHSEVVTLLIDANCNVNAQNRKRLTALHDAATNGYSEVVTLLIEAKCNVNAKEYEGRTALHDAAKNGHSEVVTLLIDAECNVNAQNESGWTALHRAAENGHSEVVTLLIDAECNVNAKDDEGQTALDYASRNDHFNITSQIRNVNAQNRERQAALDYATEGCILAEGRLLSNPMCTYSWRLIFRCFYHD